MKHKLIINDIKNNKWQAAATTFFFGISIFVFSLTILLFVSLLGSIDSLMKKADTPDYLQMHAGEIDKSEIEKFADNNNDVSEWQICRFFNLENATLSLGEKSLSENTQDNGLCVQSEKFDYLIGMDNEIIYPNEGEVYVPVCYKKTYDVSTGDYFTIGTFKLKIAGFLRDSQMNSMMASSKRFLVNEKDYIKIAAAVTGSDLIGNSDKEEYLIEFLLVSGADVSAFSSSYIDASLPDNGPAITKSLIKLMNALSDGLLILVILLISVVVLIISIICIRFIMMTGLERTKKETGLLKAIGISNKEIRKVYSQKFIFLSLIGMAAGIVFAAIISMPLMKNMKELYGRCENIIAVMLGTLIAAAVTELICCMVVNSQVKKLEKLSAIKALYDDNIFSKKRKGQYIMLCAVTIAAVFLMILPENLNSTISAKDFVSYMGIGDAQLRFDIRQSSDKEAKTEEIEKLLNNDKSVEKFISLKTSPLKISIPEGNENNENNENNEKTVILTTEFGDHTVFPVKYSEGHAPNSDDEIAISVLNAEDLELKIGDTIKVSHDEKSENRDRKLTVCGIYSDITNGGKTAKACFDYDGEIQWSIFYLNLIEGESIDAIKEKYSGIVQVTCIDEYLQGTYGPTLKSIKAASILSKVISSLIMFVVTTLFLTLLIEQERFQISFKKAIGISKSIIRKDFVRLVRIYPVVGIVSGIIAGCFLGQGIVGMILSKLGAGSFSFVINSGMTFIVIPLVTVTVFALSVCASMKNIDAIRATECVYRRE